MDTVLDTLSSCVEEVRAEGEERTSNGSVTVVRNVPFCDNRAISERIHSIVPPDASGRLRMQFDETCLRDAWAGKPAREDGTGNRFPNGGIIIQRMMISMDKHIRGGEAPPDELKVLPNGTKRASDASAGRKYPKQ
uniref:Uncharacterized protein n=1 Tax=Anopheles coluzzii TaxID=1518534 RepID=A0A8W7PXM5_ANOCL